MGIPGIICKELLSVKENVPFSLATIISPLLFLFAFTVMVSGGITIPVETLPDPSGSEFLQSTAQFRAPDGTAYLKLEAAPAAGDPDGRSTDRYVVVSEPQAGEDGATGTVVHLVNDVNSNMTKNYANRLSGALVEFVNDKRQAGTVEVLEQTRYPVDIPWDESFAVSTLVFGAMLAGLLFRQFSMTSEWENATATLLFLSPRRATTVVASKMTAAVVKSLVAGAVLVCIAALMFHRELANAFFLTATLCLMYIAFAGLGLALGTVVRSTMPAFLVSLVVSLCLWVAGGGFGDLSYFGRPAQVVGAANPATYALNAVRYAYFGGISDPTPLIVLLVGATITTTGVTALYARWSRSEKAVS